MEYILTERQFELISKRLIREQKSSQVKAIDYVIEKIFGNKLDNIEKTLIRNTEKSLPDNLKRALNDLDQSLFKGLKNTSEFEDELNKLIKEPTLRDSIINTIATQKPKIFDKFSDETVKEFLSTSGIKDVNLKIENILELSKDLSTAQTNMKNLMKQIGFSGGINEMMVDAFVKKNYSEKGIIKPLVRKAVIRSTTPIGYDPLKLINAPAEILLPKATPKSWSTKNRMDAWYLYNGAKPKYDSFTKIGDNTYRIKNFVIDKETLDKIVKYPKSKFSTVEIENELNFGAIHGNGGITKGTDKMGNYIEFYDEWDLQPLKAFKSLPSKVRNFEVSSITGGKPFWTKNKIYYDANGNYYDWDYKPLHSISEYIKNGDFEGMVDYLVTRDLKDISVQQGLDDWNRIASKGMEKTMFTMGAPLAVFTLYQQGKLKEKEKKVYINMIEFGKKKNMTLQEVKHFCDNPKNEQECLPIWNNL